MIVCSKEIVSRVFWKCLRDDFSLSYLKCNQNKLTTGKKHVIFNKIQQSRAPFSGDTNSRLQIIIVGIFQNEARENPLHLPSSISNQEPRKWCRTHITMTDWQHDISSGCFFQSVFMQNDSLQAGDSVQSLLDMLSG
jgi:hypothetical protein